MLCTQLSLLYRRSKEAKRKQAMGDTVVVIAAMGM